MLPVFLLPAPIAQRNTKRYRLELTPFLRARRCGDFINHSPLAKPNKTVFKYQKTLVQDRTSCMIEISFCELSGILEKGIKGINNGEIE
ncbi:hypothetical protein OIU89_06615 [Escherichia coli]|nr:hypothetical protein [Escherichia coli]